MRTATLIVLGLAATALASCPNSCSGHGRCKPGDVCECFLQADDRTPAYIAPDCSKRVCPSGEAFGALSDLTDVVDFVAFDQQTQFSGEPQPAGNTAQLDQTTVDTRDYKLSRSATFVVRVLEVDVANNLVKVQWKLKEHVKFSQTIDINAGAAAFSSMVELVDTNRLLPNFGTTAHDTGVRIWFKLTTDVRPNHLYTFTVNYRGKAVTFGEPNSVHQFVECSGKGSCDYSAGRCTCDPGYGGEACQRLDCPSDCSGHGVCQSLRRFVQDADSGNTLSYANAWDAEKVMSCLCDIGYRGPDCSQIECPSGSDPMGGPGGLGTDEDGNLVDARDCSGRGSCDYSSGTCGCFSGYHGERCEFQSTFV